MEAPCTLLVPETCLGMPPLPDLVAAATPYFFLFIAMELGLAAARGRKLYNLRQTVSNVSAGLLQALLGVFTKALHVLPYQALHARWGLQPTGGPAASSGYQAWWLHTATSFLLCDLLFYWFHRACHVTNLGWAAHVAHHSSPDFNLGTALRQGALEVTISWVFFLPLALLCPLRMFAVHRGIVTFYQFFTHTQLVGKLWWPLELVLNTPSHHRVHHARNYGRRNFGGVLIVWDRLFGTFEEERVNQPCIYGLDSQVRPEGTFNPLWHQLHHFACTLHFSVTQGPMLAALFTRKYGAGMAAPWVVDAEPPGPGEKECVREAPVVGPRCAAKAGPPAGSARTAGDAFPWDPRPLGFLDLYAAAHFFGGVLPGALCTLRCARGADPRALAAGAAWLVLTVTSLGQLLEGTARGVWWELLRLAAQVAGAKYALSQPPSLLLPPGAYPRLLVLAVGALSGVSGLLLGRHLVSMSAATDVPARRKGA